MTVDLSKEERRKKEKKQEEKNTPTQSIQSKFIPFFEASPWATSKLAGWCDEDCRDWSTVDGDSTPACAVGVSLELGVVKLTPESAETLSSIGSSLWYKQTISKTLTDAHDCGKIVFILFAFVWLIDGRSRYCCHGWQQLSGTGRGAKWCECRAGRASPASIGSPIATFASFVRFRGFSYVTKPSVETKQNRKNYVNIIGRLGE